MKRLIRYLFDTAEMVQLDRALQGSEWEVVDGGSYTHALPLPDNMDCALLSFCHFPKRDAALGDGALVSRLRARAPNLPILVVVDDNDLDNRELALEFGATALLPIMDRRDFPERLIAALSELFPPHKPSNSPTDRLETLAERVEAVASGLAELRINSDEANNAIASLRAVAAGIRGEAKRKGIDPTSLGDMQREAKRVLPLLLTFYESSTARRAAQMIVSGAIAWVLATGWPAAAVFSVSMAAWEGEDSLRKAIETFLNRDWGEARRETGRVRKS